MSLLKRCLVIINNRSGCRHNIHAYTDTLKQYMDRAGIVHRDLYIPNDDITENLRRSIPHVEAVVICGGDGTVNSVVNSMATMKATRGEKTTSSGELHDLSTSSSSSFSHCKSVLEDTPLLLVPTGLHNSLTTSLGIGAAERAVSSLVVGRTVRVPLWAVHLHSPMASPSSPTPVRYMCSYIAAGTYATIVQRQEKWKEAQEDYVLLPALFGSFAATSLYTTVEHATPHCTVEMTTSAGSNDSAAPTLCSVSALRMLVAAQMPQLQSGYSLTPTATYHQRRLTVTTATDDVTRMRMWHLLRREAREGYILSEDGVAMHEGVRRLRINFPCFPGESAGARKEMGTTKEGNRRGETDGEKDAALLVLDGECVRVPYGSSVTVTPTELSAQFIIS